MKRIYTDQGVKFVEEFSVIQETVIDLDEELITIGQLQDELDKRIARLGIFEKDMSKEEKAKMKDKIDKVRNKKVDKPK